jgi:S-ribosylhomocysteine lyase LuxS involved in autoinducer biosynthesis
MQLCFQSLKLQNVYAVSRKDSIENEKHCSKAAKHELSRIKSLVKTYTSIGQNFNQTESHSAFCSQVTKCQNDIWPEI